MPETLVSISGARLRIEGIMEKPRAVFVHGLSGDLHTWDCLWSPARAALRYDLRGHGQSAGEEGASFNHATDLLQLLDALDIERCDLVGVSMGGSIALNFALNHPGRVSRMVLISPGMVGWEWSETWRALWAPIAERARAGALDEARQLWWQHPLFQSTRQGAAAESLHASIMRFSCEPWIRDDHEPLLPDLERVHSLCVPTLLMSGGLDLEDFRLMADLIEASAADSVERVMFPGCGHLIHLEDPQGCAALIDMHLAKNHDL